MGYLEERPIRSRFTQDAGCPILGASLFLRQGWETSTLNRPVPQQSAFLCIPSLGPAPSRASPAIVVAPGDAVAFAEAIERAVDAAPGEGRAARRRSLAERLSKPDCLSDFRAFVMREAANWAGQGGAIGGGLDGVERPHEALG